jgi:hypothetical protein
VEGKKMTDVDVGEKERRGMRVKDLKRKKRKCVERGKKGERKKETYERIQSMRGKKKA